jgi:hypothetical protein
MKSIFKIMFITASFIFSKDARAQVQTVAAKSLSPVQQILRWEGHWEGLATLHVNDKTYKSMYYADFKKTADNNGLYMNERVNIPGVGKLIGANLIGFNPNDGKIHWFSVDNMGTAHEHIGQFTNDNDFYMEHSSMQQGKQYIEKINVNITGLNTIWAKLVATLDGNVQQAFEVTFTRK